MVYQWLLFQVSNIVVRWFGVGLHEQDSLSLTFDNYWITVACVNGAILIWDTQEMWISSFIISVIMSIDCAAFFNSTFSTEFSEDKELVVRKNDSILSGHECCSTTLSALRNIPWMLRSMKYVLKSTSWAMCSTNPVLAVRRYHPFLQTFVLYLHAFCLFRCCSWI